MLINNPFTPKSGIEPRFFMDREKEIEFFKRALRETEAGRPSHFIVLGDWGTGKTSLLKELKRIAQTEGSICSLVSIRDFEGKDSLRDGIEYLVGEIAIRLPLDVSKLQKFTKELNSVGVSIAGTGFQFSKDVVRSDPQTFFYLNMLNLWGDVKNQTKTLVVLLDDVQHFASISVIMSVIRNTLADEKIVKETKVLFVLASTSDGWKPFLQRDHPIGRYFTPRMKLANLSEADSMQLIDTYLKGSNVEFSRDVRRLVYQYARGHLYETHVLCSHLFDNQIKGKVKKDGFEPALNLTLETLGEEIFNALFDKASSSEQQILHVLAEYGALCPFSELVKLSNQKYGVSKKRMADILDRLVDKRIISKPKRGVYSIDDALFREFIKVQFSQ
jgi:AAA+ ATPase superfamily predicted ATPase